MKDTPEETKSQEALDEEVERFLRAHGWDEGILLQYAMVVHIVMPPTDDGEDCTGYQIVYRGGSAPDHVALGLFAIGKRYVEEGYRRRLLGDEE